MIWSEERANICHKVKSEKQKAKSQMERNMMSSAKKIENIDSMNNRVRNIVNRALGSLVYKTTRGMVKNNERGMTLIEIMIVLVILAGIGGILITQVTGSLKKSKIKNAQILISELGKTLDTYYTDCGSYPDDLDALVTDPGSCSNWGPEPYLKKVPKDPWNNDFVYEPSGSSYELISLGEDGEEGGDGHSKDISSEGDDDSDS